MRERPSEKCPNCRAARAALAESERKQGCLLDAVFRTTRIIENLMAEPALARDPEVREAALEAIRCVQRELLGGTGDAN